MLSLDSLFNPTSVALIGATPDETKLGGIVLRNLLSFSGNVYPVNPHYREVMGITGYRSATDLPGPVDLAVVLRPAPEVPAIIRELGGKTGCVIIVSAGFTEVGEEALQNEVRALGRELGIRLLGPNCLGVYHPRARLDTFFLPPARLKRPRRGTTAVVSQSGAVLITLLEALAKRGTGVSTAVNYGNAVDIDAQDIFDYLAEDDETEVVISYLESVGDGRRFAASAARLAQRKPLVLLKAGKGGSGGAAAFSHTGRLAGRYDVFRSIMAQFGIRETEDFDGLLDAAHALSFRRPLPGNRVCIITNAGGAGVLAADECGRQALDLPPLPDEVKDRLRRAFPPFYAIGNPTDLTGQVRDDDYRLTLDAVREHYDGFVVIALTGVAGITLHLNELLRDFQRKADKPVALYVEQGELAARLVRLLEKEGMPAFPSPERAVRGLRALLVRHGEPPPSLPAGEGRFERSFRDRNVAAEAAGTLRAFLAARPGRTSFLEHEVKGLLREMGIPVPRGIAIGGGRLPPGLPLAYPLVAKVASARITSKSDVGGVRLGLADEAALHRAITELLLIDHAEEVLVEEEAPRGVEVIIGGTVDPQFGPIVMFGLGGFLVELFRDVAFALAPVSPEEALRLIERTRGARLLRGFRGEPPVDLEALVLCIVTVSELMATGLLEEIDLNPVSLYPRGALVLDAKLKTPGV